MNKHERILFKLAYYRTLSEIDKYNILQGLESNNKLVNNIQF